jgi:3-oxoacyl-[acyl-carrier protein] reductase
MSVASRTAVITGGAGAIGSAIVGALRATGHQTVVLDRTGDVEVDLSDEQSTRRAAAEVIERYGRCDVFVHCAAAFDPARLQDLDAATWRHVHAVNVESALWLAQAFTPGMAERTFGRIVFITSDTFWDPPADVLLPYIASKAALTGVMRSLSRALGPDGISVTAVAPGLTDTAAAHAINSEETFDTTVAKQSLNRRLTPADTAAAVAFLASDGAAAMTGQVLCADGGLVLR